jgi:muconolactone delta-isomerase
MKILALEQEIPGADGKAFAPHLKAEARRVWELTQEGVIREIYFRSDRDSAVLVLECDDEDEARHILDTLPLVSEGLIAINIIPMKPYPGFARLFD